MSDPIERALSLAAELRRMQGESRPEDLPPPPPEPVTAPPPVDSIQFTEIPPGMYTVDGKPVTPKKISRAEFLGLD